jgi:hypothetical protein
MLSGAFMRLYRSTYARWFSVFALLQITFLILVYVNIIPFEGSQAGVEDSQTTFFICSVHLLLTINTVVFLLDIRVLSNIQDLTWLSPADKKDIKGAYTVFMVLLICSVAASGIVSAVTFLTWVGVISHNYWKVVIQGTEIASSILFSYFLIGDLCCLYVGRKALRLYSASISNGSADKTSFNKTAVEQKVLSLNRYILAVDAPGAIGLWLIFACSHLLYPAFIQVMYWEGFVAGAIGLHIMFSQASLACLSVLDDV